MPIFGLHINTQSTNNQTREIQQITKKKETGVLT